MLKLRTEVSSSLASRTARFFKTKPKKVSGKLVNRKMHRYNAISTKVIKRTRNDLITKVKKLEKKFDVESLIIFLDKNIDLLDKIDKALESLKLTLKDYEQDFKIQTRSTGNSSGFKHTVSLVISGKEDVTDVILSSTPIAKFEKQFMDQVLGKEKLGDEIVKSAIFGTKISRKSTERGKLFTSIGKDLKKSESKSKEAEKGIINTAAIIDDEVSGYKELEMSQPEVLSLIGIINAKLRLAVIKNMGTPSLVNRTGTFASSVFIKGITKTEHDMVLKYTYRRDPYVVFEQELGKAPWNSVVQRDPKSIIEASLRDIARDIKLKEFGLNVHMERVF